MTDQSTTKIDIPAWIPTDPRLWFRLVEDCFKLQKTKDGSQAVTTDKQRLIMVGAKVPGPVMIQHKAYYFAGNYKAFKDAVCRVAVKTDASLFREFIEMKLTEGMAPSAFIQQLLVILGNLADNSSCRTPRQATKCDESSCRETADQAR